MKATTRLLPLAVLGSFLGARHLAAPPDPAALSRAFQEIVREVGPAVVGVRAERAQMRRGGTTLGSGVLLRPEGIVVTNNHVVADATDVTVLLDDVRTVPARVVGLDRQTDLAVLRLPEGTYPAAELGPDGPPEVGEWVLAVGNPLGLGRAVTAGIVSGLGRSALNIADYEDFIQTDAAINSGNSGGALLDLEGRVVGINTAKGTSWAGSVGLGFAIPAHIVREVVDELLKSGQVRRGWLGVTMDYASPTLARHAGFELRRAIQVKGVYEGSPAERAGIRVDDVILAIDGYVPRDLPDMLLEVARLDPGSRVDLEVFRDGEAHRLEVRLGDRDLEGVVQ